VNKPDIEALLASDDSNSSVIDLDNYLGELCAYGENPGALTKPQLLFYLNQQLEREVNNGGFHQFFFNSTGDYSYETIESLKAIGATYTCDLVRAAIDEFPNSSIPEDIIVRRQLMIELWPDSENEKWNELDTKFFEYKDDLNELNLKYVAANRAEF